ncbi:MAG: fasciclin domain-containing protein [Balneolaceae bacterium]|nr:fasciclin domain-containing protein [Balneolaceae bacterium]MBO6547085.1 fasciclin domain-containing protein [Balneolaceae bacterium]MBO6647968.1 fasciclin domain-containing protein [Balneolaceae bacterium]
MENLIRKITLGLGVLLLCFCTKVEQQDSASLENNTPLGQASVVDEDSEPNILQIAIRSEDHSTLVAAVQAAEIEHILVNAGPLTVFAPVNSAFEALPEGAVEDLLKPENKAKLTGVLTKHAAPGSYDLAGLKKEADRGRRLYMADGSYLTITVEGDDIFVEGAKVIASVQTSNGIVNVVDKVIL